MSRERTLSIVLPNRNHAQFLTRCLSGMCLVERNSLWPTEIIVVDDCSTDDSVKIVDAFALVRNIKLIRLSTNVGTNGAIMEGLKHATGDFLYFAASDDYVNPRFWERCKAVLDSYPDAVMCCCVGDWREEHTGARWKMGSMMGDTGFISPKRAFWLDLTCRLWIPGHSVIVERRAFEKAGLFSADVKHAADWYTESLIAFSQGFCFVNEPLAVNCIQPGGYFKRVSSDKQANREAMVAILEGLLKPENSQPCTIMIQSGALYIWGWPMIKAALSSRRYWRFITVQLALKAALFSCARAAKNLLHFKL